MSSRYNSLQYLEPEDQEPPVFFNGHSLVLAGAGSGKTRVITNKAARLLLDEVPEERILLSTFTKNAAGEMKQRIKEITGQGDNMTIGTIHSIFFSVVKSNYSLLGYESPRIIVYEDDDTKEIVTDILHDIKSSDNKLGKLIPDVKHKKPKFDTLVKTMISNIDLCRRNIEDPSRFKPVLVGGEFLEDSITDAETRQMYKDVANTNLFYTVYDRYKKKLLADNAIDYMGMQHFAWWLFTNYEDIKDGWKNRFNYVLIDEAQDISKIQWELIKITSENSFLTLVGDEQQNLYEWRGASPDFMREFLDNYKPAVFTVRHNYRSERPILNLANNISKDLELIKERELKPTSDDSNCEIKCVGFNDFMAEIDYIVSMMLRLHGQGYNWGDMVVGVRTRKFLERIMRMLVSKNIPVMTNRGVDFFRRKEVKTILNYLRAIINPHNDYVMRQILLDCRGIGEGTINRLKSSTSTSLYDRIIREHGNSKGMKSAKNAVNMIDEMQMTEKPIEYLLNNCVDQQIAQSLVGKLQLHIPENKRENVDVNKDNVMALSQALEDYTPLGPDNCADFMEEMVNRSVAVNNSNKKQQQKDAVMITTGHGTKGQEWKIAFYPVMVEDVFPVNIVGRQEDPQEKLQEELRLFYVCTTRAMHKLFYTYATFYGKNPNSSMISQPSRFLEYVNGGW